MTCTEKVYIEDATSLEDRVNRYGQIIDALELRLLNVGTESAETEEYSIDDGQVKIKTIYRDLSSITTAIENLTKLRQKLINKLNGHGFVLRPWRGLI